MIVPKHTRRLSGFEPDRACASMDQEQLAVSWTATLLARHGDADVADAYARSRLDGDWGAEFGTLPGDAPLATIGGRAVPHNR